VHDLRTGKRTRDLAFPQVVAIFSPAWSPDATQLAFSGAGPGGMVDLYTVTVDSGVLCRLTDDLYDDRDPAWSPDGRCIAFSSDRCSGGRRGQRNLFVLEPGSGSVRRLTAGAHDDVQPAWSPDGRRIAFSSDRDSVANIYAIPVAAGPDSGLRHGTPQQVTRVLTGAFDPAWLEDGSGLLFTGYEAGAFQIYRSEPAVDSLAAAVVLWPPGCRPGGGRAVRSRASATGVICRWTWCRARSRRTRSWARPAASSWPSATCWATTSITS
jgi:Tol biopolymer transport system component